MNLKLIFSGLMLFNICLAAVAQDKIYIGNQGTDSIYVVNASNLGDLQRLLAVYNPEGIAYFHNNPTYRLFYATSDDIFRDNSSGTAQNRIIDGISLNRGVAIDYLANKIYWANSQQGFIKRANLNGNGQQTLLSGLDQPYDIEIDLVNQKIYWTEQREGGNIKRANLADGSNIETLVTGIYATGVAIDPFRNKLFYTNLTETNVYAANSDGTGATLINTEGYGDIDVDYASGKVYFSNYSNLASLRKLFKCNPDGSSLTFISQGGPFIEYADRTAPLITEITRHDPDTSIVVIGDTVTFNVRFSEPVLRVNKDDFQTGGTASGTITSVTRASDDYKHYHITISNIAGEGILNLNTASTNNIIDARGNPLGSSLLLPEFYYVLERIDVIIPPQIKPPLLIYPNPAQLYIDIASAELIIYAEIVSRDGQVQMRLTNLDNQRIDIAGLEPGTYILRVRTATQALTESFIKQQ